MSKEDNYFVWHFESHFARSKAPRSLFGTKIRHSASRGTSRPQAPCIARTDASLRLHLRGKLPAGISEFIQANEYAIGYIDAGHGHRLGLSEVALQNKNGKSRRAW